MEREVKVLIRLKNGVLDPQGKAIADALRALGFKNVLSARVGKLIELKVKEKNSKRLKTEIEKMCKKLLANPVIENFEFVIKE